MSSVTYSIVEHDGGWAYRVGDVLSETYPTHDAARRAAERAAARQRVPGETGPILFEDPGGEWLEETASGRDRPSTEVKG